ncbi:hypothetical protein AO368_0243 [Moraxella catarrhalis]|uniref:DUF389 domain-containing protein n=1 Tax=Moraxella catarrhalis TaxID=480 RepID=UPI0007E3E144|nr:DUF389 domain-containing protein [Moraxella catarrhalis]OAV32640.1 hypothetical protein AO368_0243 [Moraxella catarrhalis]
MTTPKPTVSPHVNIDLSLLIFYQPPIEKLTNHLLTWPAMYAQLLAKKRVQEQQKQSNNETKDGDDGITLTEEDIENLIEQGFSEETIESVSKAVNEQLSKNANDDAKQDDHADNNLPKGDDANQTHLKTKPITKKSSTPNDFSHTSSPNQIKACESVQNLPYPAKTDDTKSHVAHALAQSADASVAKIAESLDNDIHEAVEKQLKEQQEQQEQQYEAFKQYLAKKNSETAIDYRQIRIDIESGALPTRHFYLMNGLSAVIAGFGLLANSPAVVIGAMLIAMLIGPISGIALAIIDARLALLKKSLLTLLSGGALIYAIGVLLGFLYPDQAASQEIIARTAPNTMDVFVALAGGVAGAYALISRNLSVAVVGVAVATALVPPLTASGILLATGHYQLALGALILTLTNILAIQFTNALVLWAVGFRRLDIDKSEDETVKDSRWQQNWLFIRRNIVTLILLIGLSVYLTLDFQQRIRQKSYEKAVIEVVQQQIQYQPSYVVSSDFGVVEKGQNNKASADSYMIRVLLQGLIAPSHQDISQMEQNIQTITTERYPKRSPIKLQVRFVPEQVIETTPVSKADVKLDDASISQLEENKN